MNSNIKNFVNFTSNPKLSEVNYGTVIIVDISGFTELVLNTELVLGRDILYHLLVSIIQKNNLKFSISEIEGDAIFFYKLGNPPSKEELIKLYCEMFKNFHTVLLNINNGILIDNKLSIKMIVHYGAIAKYQIGNFSKLYGAVVLEAHLLLKNNIQSNSYVLITERFSKTFQESSSPYSNEKKQCENIRGFKKICYSYYDFSSKKKIISMES